MTGQPCAAPRHDDTDDPPRCEPHAHLCRPCRVSLRRDLCRIPALYAALEESKAVTRRSPGNGGGLPLNEPAAECQGQIRHDLTWWAVLIAGQRGVPPARLAALPGWQANRVPGLCGWLYLSLNWIPYRAWAPDMAAALAEDAGRALALAQPWQVSHHPIGGPLGVCPDCGSGRIWKKLFLSDGDRRRNYLACDGCGQVWWPEQWLRLGQRLIRRAEAAAS